MDWNVLFFLHMIGTLALGFYLVLPFIIGRAEKLSPAAKEGTLSAVTGFNRFAQYGLVIQLLTGGYMMTKGDYSVAWMIIIVVLLLAMFALGGIMSKPLRLAAAGIRENRDVKAETGKLRTLSALLSVSLLLMVFFMVFNDII
ncbi:hypothetical protein CA600_25790 [Paenibacillus sp. VTT E-133280]|jgi:hypothetical protein|uniref:Copper resistance protein D domain-containing protein n=2 Tax=Paenibacillus TaxID=44249 RepID=A0A1R0ZQI9_9BACL|nr:MULTISPECIES: hypothetical protein [Paenibacillus]AIQ23016.1 hypothetical protein H70737_09210 [Paenibacillus sp. FSL H7-0737]AIQ34851.1 hypothetical protein R50345_09645 [Paenibacillus sp. FSL R5-0345]KAA1186296.1 hypothetical protein PAENI_15750 [Paenibacillus sp. B2(2019)]MDH6370511.1 hypothetical protein [Paenibacillus sp. PastF-3]OMD35203.1 hypothetical protein BSK52_27500 [Paenibacillus odorifer]